MMGLTPEGIVERTAVQSRRRAAPHEATSDLGAEALRKALEHSHLSSNDLDAVFLATVSHDEHCSPPTSMRIMAKLGIPAMDNGKPVRHVPGFDMSVACSSFVSTLANAYWSLRAGAFRTVAVVAADVTSRIVSWTNPKFYFLMGDGGAAWILQRVPASEDRFLGPEGFLLGSDGSGADLISAPAGGSRRPLTPEDFSDPTQAPHLLRMEGRQVFNRILDDLPGHICTAAQRAGITVPDIDCLALHQANGRMSERAVKTLRKKYGFRGEVPSTIEWTGNTTSASVPLVCEEGVRKGMLRSGSLACLAAFGGGLTWSICFLRW